MVLISSVKVEYSAPLGEHVGGLIWWDSSTYQLSALTMGTETDGRRMLTPLDPRGSPGGQGEWTGAATVIQRTLQAAPL